MANVTVNAMGQQCPIPVVQATRALEGMKDAGDLIILVDNLTATENLRRMAAGHQLTASVEQKGEREFVVTIPVPQPVARSAAPAAEPACVPCGAGDLVAAVDTDAMGRGSDELGKTLMKGFLFALGQLPQPPKTILFYNGGARLTCEGSASLEDLRALAAKGTEILTCGTCLNYYGLTEKLAVGGVTNMYAIVEKLANAGKVIKP